MKSPRIKDCSEKDVGDVLKKIFMLIGLVNKPDTIETDVLIDFVKNDLKKYTLEEIELSFRMALKGKLYERINGKDEQLNLNHYNNFSAAYLSRVINAYENKRREAIKKENMKPVEEKQLSAQDKLSSVKRGIIENFELFKNTGEIGQITAWQFAELWKMGVIKFTNERISQMKKDCIEPFRELMAAEKKDLVDKFSIERIVKKIENPEDTQAFKAFCRKYALKQYFKDLVEMGQDIKELL